MGLLSITTLLLPWALLLALLALCCAQDLRQRRIPNAYCVAGLLVALVLHATLPRGEGFFVAAQAGALGLWPATQAALLMLLVGVVMWKLKFFGAGDAKLLAAVAALVGLKGIAPVLLLTTVFGAAMAVYSLHRRGVLGVWLLGFSSGLGLAPQKTGIAPVRLPYSLAIAAGSVTYAVLASTGRGHFF